MNGLFPTIIHEAAAAAIVAFARTQPVAAVLLVNSCARGRAIPESDLDVALLVDLPAEDCARIEAAWLEPYAVDETFRRLERLGPFSRVHLDVFDGAWVPPVWDDGGGPDAFEIEIGNRVAHAVPLFQASDAFAALRARWLPYYDERLRQERLAMVSAACRLDLERVRFGVARGLPFYAFDRLYHAFQEFLQALFICRRVYPLAYDKWLEEQVAGWLGLPSLFTELLAVLDVGGMDGGLLIQRADRLEEMLAAWTVPEASAT